MGPSEGRPPNLRTSCTGYACAVHTVRYPDLLRFILTSFETMLRRPRFGGDEEMETVMKKETERCDDVVELGAVTVETKGIGNSGPPDGVAGLRQFQTGLSAE